MSQLCVFVCVCVCVCVCLCVYPFFFGFPSHLGHHRVEFPVLYNCGGGLVTKSSLTLLTPMDCSLPSSAVHGISQAKILEWVAISVSWASFQPKNRT